MARRRRGPQYQRRVSPPGYQPPDELLLGLVERAWSNGWQPHELHRQVRRQADRAAIELAELVLAIDHASRPADAYHPHWQAQVDALKLPTVEAGSATASMITSADPGLLVQLLEAWTKVGPLPVLLPPPAGVRVTSVVDLAAGQSGKVADPVLEKVRALLDKAEATTFPAEAESFTAKAHELIARHSIDDALLQRGRNGEGRGSGRGGAAVTIRIPIDAPYAKSKYLMVQLVAEAGGCRAVYHPQASMSSVVGHASDVGAVEMLYTSLLVQAQTALNSEGGQAGSGDRRRSRGYRSSFLLAYAHRVGERLDEVRIDVRSEAEAAAVSAGGSSLVPLMAERDAEVAAHFEELFAEVRSTRVSGGRDPFGWASGHEAANQASLGAPSVRKGAAGALGARRR